MKNYKKFLGLTFLSLMLSLFSFTTFAANASPVGKWTTISDSTGKPRSILQITESNNMLYGKVIKIYPEAGDTGICDKCSGNFKNKKILGLTIMWGLKQNSDGTWSGGQILDPKIGKIYRVKLTVAPDGKTIKARGYIGISLLGRTQTWIRSK